MRRIFGWLAITLGMLGSGLDAAPVATVDSVRFRNFGIASGLSQITACAILQD